jgi:hypothetical protein
MCWKDLHMIRRNYSHFGELSWWAGENSKLKSGESSVGLVPNTTNTPVLHRAIVTPQWPELVLASAC